MSWLSEQRERRAAKRASTDLNRIATASGRVLLHSLGGGHTGHPTADKLAECSLGGVALVIGFHSVCRQAIDGGVEEGASVTPADGEESPARDDPRGIPLFRNFLDGMSDPIRAHCAVRVGAWIYFADSLARHGEGGYRRRMDEAVGVFGQEHHAEQRVVACPPPVLEASPISNNDEAFLSATGRAMIEAAADDAPPIEVFAATPFAPLWSYTLIGSRDYLAFGRVQLNWDRT